MLLKQFKATENNVNFQIGGREVMVKLVDKPEKHCVKNKALGQSHVSVISQI